MRARRSSSPNPDRVRCSALRGNCLDITFESIFKDIIGGKLAIGQVSSKAQTLCYFPVLITKAKVETPKKY